MIGEIRQHLASLLKLSQEHDTWSYLPDDANLVPCYVVGRPTITLETQLITATTTVWCVGRRLSDEDAQIELDRMTDVAVAMLRGPDVNVAQVVATVATISELSYPAYAISCVTGGSIC